MSITLCGIGLAVVPPASADPAEPADAADAPSAAAPVPPPVAATGHDNPTATPEVEAACSQFAGALNLAAINYSDFANALALGEVDPNYADPIVSDSNMIGRTALRQAAGAALSASRTPGVPHEISAPMRSWSLGATKLLILMGMRADVDRINNAATGLNDDTASAQMACAQAGTHA